MMKKHPLTPMGLRLMLTISLFIIAIAGSVIFTLTNSSLRDTAKEVSHTIVDASASQNNIQTFQKIQRELTEQKAIVDRASSIVAESKSYQYQDQIITDLNNYATKAGITITNIDFSASTQTVASATGKPAATPVINGVKSTSASITLKNPISYNNMLRFIKSIEQNLTKMQLSRINLAKDAASGGVSSQAFTLEVYIR